MAPCSALQHMGYLTLHTLRSLDAFIESVQLKSVPRLVASYCNNIFNPAGHQVEHRLDGSSRFLTQDVTTSNLEEERNAACAEVDTMQRERIEQTSNFSIKEFGDKSFKTVIENVFKIEAVTVTLEEEVKKDTNDRDLTTIENAAVESGKDESLDQTDATSITSWWDDADTVVEKPSLAIEDKGRKEEEGQNDVGDKSTMEMDALEMKAIPEPKPDRMNFELSTNVHLEKTDDSNKIVLITHVKFFSKDVAQQETSEREDDSGAGEGDDKKFDQENGSMENLAGEEDAEERDSNDDSRENSEASDQEKLEKLEKIRAELESKFEKKEKDIQTLISDPVSCIDGEISSKISDVAALLEKRALLKAQNDGRLFRRQDAMSPSRGSSSRSASPATPFKSRVQKDGMTATANQETKVSDLESGGRRESKPPGGAQAPRKAATNGARAASTSPKKAGPKNGLDSPAKTPNSEQKRIPPIKAPVGKAPNPNVKEVRSKIGSMDNIKHKPKGGEKKVCAPTILITKKYPCCLLISVVTQKLEWNTSSKIGSLDNATHKAGGGEKKILTQKLNFKEKAQSKIGSLENAAHKPGGGNVKVRGDSTLPETELPVTPGEA
ncbi:MAP2 [Cordylochernes scorpioides]|uniref:Microtubule-associated protein n=1 Tax=Cordylochernes scorpioides TaxID=51811 RepID=A0ABY6LXF3_9ARAC|nr:MAP2 [Cordylochernes scorpioides]